MLREKTSFLKYFVLDGNQTYILNFDMRIYYYVYQDKLAWPLESTQNTVAIKTFDIFLKGSHGQTAWSDPVLPAKLYQQHPCKF